VDSELYRRAREVFVRAIDLEPGARSRLVESDCRDDEALRREVSSLLAAHESGGFDSVARKTSASPPPIESVRIPERIGSYRILDLLGEGGMGVVYEAEQENPRRTVALKILHPGVASPSRLRRFEQEAQILGRLHHPGIAQVYEAGTADAGSGPQPYLAMELVEGRPLVEDADARGLGARERIELLVRICRAVHHAHERGVVHRDLKPANILVDAQGTPKVLDFGIARATAEGLETRTMLTSAGEVLGTLPYMSPEQIDTQGPEVDARTDVYSLGVIGYELLSGRLPIDLSRKGLPEAARSIREDSPVPLGSAVRSLRGDVETILAKALEKERSRRYATALELAEDLERWLRQEPIVARPASAMYQLSRFAKRNSVLVGGVAGVFLALLLGLAATLWKAAETRAETRRAQAELEFIRDALTSVSPDASGRDVPMIRVVDDAARSLGEAFPGEPRIEAPLQETLGETYRNLGRVAESETHLRRAVELSRIGFGPDDQATTRAETELAQTLVMQEKLDEGERLVHGAIDRVRSHRGYTEADEVPPSIILARSLCLRGKYGEAQPWAERGLEIRRRLFGDADSGTVDSINELALLRFQQGRTKEAIDLQREGLELQKRVPKEKLSLTLSMMNGLAQSLLLASRPEEAKEVLDQLIDRERTAFGEEDYRTLTARNTLAGVLSSLGRNDEAADLEEKVLATARRTLGDTHAITLAMLDRMAAYRVAQGRVGEAADLVRIELEGSAKAYGELAGETIDAEFDYAGYLVGAKRVEDADAALGHALATAGKAFPAGDPMRTWYEKVRRAAYLLSVPGRLEEAERLLDESWPAIERAFGPNGQRTRYAVQVRMMVYDGLGKKGEAGEMRKRLQSGG